MLNYLSDLQLFFFVWKFHIHSTIFQISHTFHNISIISWQSVLLVEETGVPGKTTDLQEVIDKLSHNVVLSTPRHEWDSN